MVQDLRKISPQDLFAYEKHFYESHVIIMYSLLDSYISELTQALLVSFPNKIGENKSVTLGKILNMQSREDLILGLAKKLAREWGQWSLKNRVDKLIDLFSLQTDALLPDLNEMGERRNKLIHDRSYGEIKADNQEVKYCEHDGNSGVICLECRTRYRREVVSCIAFLYSASAPLLGINKKFKIHKENIGMLERMTE